MRSDTCKGCVGEGICSSIRTITGRIINSCRSEYIASGISACNNYAGAWYRFTPLINTTWKGESLNLAPPLSIPDPFGTGCIISLALLVFEKDSLAIAHFINMMALMNNNLVSDYSSCIADDCRGLVLKSPHYTSIFALIACLAFLHYLSQISVDVGRV